MDRAEEEGGEVEMRPPSAKAVFPQMEERNLGEGVIPQGDVIVVEDVLTAQCMRRLHLMANEEIPFSTLSSFSTPTTARIEWGEVAGSHWLKAEWIYRGVWDVDAACAEGKFRRLVVWNLEGCASVKVALYEAAHEFERLFGGRAQFGFMKKLPRGAEHGMDVGDLTLLEAEWMLERCVAVGGRLTSPPTPLQIGEHNLERGE